MDRDRWFPVHPAVLVWAEAPHYSLSEVEAARLSEKAMLNAGLRLLLRRVFAAHGKRAKTPSHSAEWDVVFCSNPSPGQVTRRRWNMQCNPASGCWKLWRNCSGDHWHAGWHTAPLFLKCEATTLVTMDVRSTWLQEKRIRAHLDRSTNEIKHFKT